MADPLPDEDKARGIERVKKDFDSDDANHAADIAIAIDDSSENSEKSLIQRLARKAARQPKKALLVSFGITILLSALGPLIAGGLELTTDTKGWRTRGTFVGLREMQAEILNLNRYQLFRDTDGSHWNLLTETVSEGYIEFFDRGNAYADPEASTTRKRRLDFEAETEAEADFSIERLATSKRSLTFEETCDASWYSNYSDVLFPDNLYAIWKVEPKEDHDATTISSSMSALDKNVLSQICKAELNTMKVLKENDVCKTCSDADGSCHPPHSLVFLLRQKMDSHEKSCEDLMDLYTTTVQQEFTDELLDCTNEYSEKFNPTTYTPGDLEVCTYVRVLVQNVKKRGILIVTDTGPMYEGKLAHQEAFRLKDLF